MRCLFFTVLLIAFGALGAEPEAHYRFTYSASITAPRGQAVRIWLPYPTEDAWQKVESAKLDAPFPKHSMREGKFGNRLWFLEGKATSQPIVLTATYRLTRRTQGAGPRHDAGTPDDPKRYRQEERKIAFSDKIRAIAKTESKGKTTPDRKIRAFYDYIVRTMAYDKSGTGWGEGDSVWACDNKRGNCTDFHSLFIALNRVAEVPARFIIGVPIADQPAGDIPGYHCWAEAYSAARGWIPVDASEAKKSGKTDFYFGHLPPDRIALSMGRDIMLEPAQKGGPLNYFVYPYAEANGAPLAKEAIQTTFHFERG